MKKVLFSVCVCFFCFFFCGCDKNSTDKMIIMTTNFPTYDFARAIVGNQSNFEVRMLISPGQEIHDFEPTPKDMADISNSKVFFYVGGESDSWVDKVLNTIDSQEMKIVKMIDLVPSLEEETLEGVESFEEEGEMDEHVWTSPKNVIAIVSYLEKVISSLDLEHQEDYQRNAQDYILQLESLDSTFKRIVDSSKKKEIVFGDRFPFLYFVKEYGLTYYAAFPGCSSSTEASAKTMQYLIQKVKEDSLPVVFHIELSSSKIAEAISKETGAKVLEFHSAHNVTLEDFKKGITYIDIMNKNVEALKEALSS